MFFFAQGKKTAPYGFSADFLQPTALISVMRQGEEIDAGIATTMGGHDGSMLVQGLNTLPCAAMDERRYANPPYDDGYLKIIRPEWFQEGDRVFVEIPSQTLRSLLAAWPQFQQPSPQA